MINRRAFLKLASLAVVLPELPKAKTLKCGVGVALGPGYYTMSMVECHEISSTVMRYKLVGVLSGRFVSGCVNVQELERRPDGEAKDKAFYREL